MSKPARLARSLVLPALLLATPTVTRPQEPTPTRVLVRAVSNDAKVLGSGVGGAHIVIRDLASGQVLAEGVQEGSTGDTGRIMGTRTRGEPVFAVEGTAAFEATLALDGPTRVEIVAEGPLGTAHAVQRASTTVLLLPGRDLLGEGVVLVLYGFTVQLEAPSADEVFEAGSTLPVRARVTMLCGCPTEPGGLWDSDRMELRAELLKDGAPASATDLAFAGETSTYTGALPLPTEPGVYTVRVTAVEPDRANAGIAEATVRVGG